MPTERKKIVKSYLLLCEGRDAERFLIIWKAKRCFNYATITPKGA